MSEPLHLSPIALMRYVLRNSWPWWSQPLLIDPLLTMLQLALWLLLQRIASLALLLPYVTPFPLSTIHKPNRGRCTPRLWNISRGVISRPRPCDLAQYPCSMPALSFKSIYNRGYILFRCYLVKSGH